MTTVVTSGAGSGYTSRILTDPDSDIAEDRNVTAAGSYSATAPVSSGFSLGHATRSLPSAGGSAPPPPDTTPPGRR